MTETAQLCCTTLITSIIQSATTTHKKLVLCFSCFLPLFLSLCLSLFNKAYHCHLTILVGMLHYSIPFQLLSICKNLLFMSFTCIHFTFIWTLFMCLKYMYQDMEGKPETMAHSCRDRLGQVLFSMRGLLRIAACDTNTYKHPSKLICSVKKPHIPTEKAQTGPF